MGHLYI